MRTEFFLSKKQQIQKKIQKNFYVLLKTTTTNDKNFSKFDILSVVTKFFDILFDKGRNNNFHFYSVPITFYIKVELKLLHFLKKKLQ